ncbi:MULTISPECIES: hypothetical protein [unclassified Methylobacterium]|jgi:hypothetical protein|uniref:hypothetical protein n=1 Tax=unclassified Methylobacterium TaxID=2615210 RepID=UPI0006F8C2B7|nr:MULTISPECIES: hypothetical protein [unclassified Methylobacterium]KQO57010.1 hypothetical protein ASF24_18195 [Methylobacterium sp. Leaf86]KQO93606.1 hypothetical protein ASF32_20845 [Methylobacterium sp. Leaf91]MBO1022684.1 hypothetical protein [Methylobacterium sp. SD274]MCC0805196.1 hypothetical protein [Methylobacterium sp. W2]MCJ2130329.1 hypothetical protein [Methylobacterium sp. E-045]
MRNLLTLVVLGFVGFVLVAMFVAPTQPDLKAWYLKNACEHLDKVSAKICDPMRQNGGQAL